MIIFLLLKWEEIKENISSVDYPPPDDAAMQNLSWTMYSESNEHSQSNDSTVFHTFVKVLLQASSQQLKNIRVNIGNNYDLYSSDISEIDREFADIEVMYLQLVQEKLKKMINGRTFAVTDHFMIDFMDVSNSIFEKVLEYRLQSLKDKEIIASAMKWSPPSTLKQKILRQQIKMSTNFIENHICDTLQICKDRYYYSDYLIDWLRSLMNLSHQDLKRFFTPIPEVLENNKHFIKSNIKFRQTVKYLINADAVVKRDTLDFVDEVLTNPDKVLKVAPPSLKKSVTLLRELFVLIDGAYDVNDQNIEALENITESLRDWIDGNSFDVYKILNAIVENVKLNLKIWPLDVQNKIYYIWSDVIML
ncbi:unnamed protein product [Arctia plantaginis]|uniref:Uncharacterized protein n=1 Tax=Arctia plantaginis TaxID=874455 RepID=A0A8S0Z3W9_ARCPL|nr:unnamed protein product [Arctia plantaginis]